MSNVGPSAARDDCGAVHASHFPCVCRPAPGKRWGQIARCARTDQKSKYQVLNAVAARMAKTLDYNPTSFHERPVPVWTTMPVVFEME